MELNIIIVLLSVIAWKVLFHSYSIKLSSPVFRNTQKKEIGAWAYYEMKTPIFPYPGLIINDGKGAACKVLEVEYNKSTKEILCRSFLEQPYCDDEIQYEHTKKINEEFGWELREVSPHILHSWKDEYEIIDMYGNYKQY